jgi:hypothetical protein
MTTLIRNGTVVTAMRPATLPAEKGIALSSRSRRMDAGRRPVQSRTQRTGK